VKQRWVSHPWPNAWLTVLVIAISVVAFWVGMTKASK
jgi:hypothetical protein